jgi:hypothetical protein
VGSSARSSWGAVALEGGPVAVEFPAVQLDDELGGRPEGVDLFAEDFDVGAVWRQVVEAAEALEAILERRAGRGRRARLGQQAANWLQGTASVTALADPFDLA